mgnify:CR=1 FL=1
MGTALWMIDAQEAHIVNPLKIELAQQSILATRTTRRASVTLLDEPTLTIDDAKFFLVSCLAFVNSLIAKSS